MPNADAVMIFSCEERKAAVLRAAQLLNCAKGTEEEREFEMLTEAIVEYDLIQEAQAPVEIPDGFMQFIRARSGHAPAGQGA
ncbi:MAG TPA: hypothetical protein VGN82_12590 [Bosea sp. (in: a-proteobacteria)]|jgi:hypothetical protein|uniref:hypothetical protein n=1 Tax=Bosea sp. (in: a-proteobacteria) TaxID=1871050 RepID=UPI002E0E6800|nr:hypothetical protein [Bosea sp. (in: a-proteobacteria)]